MLHNLFHVEQFLGGNILENSSIAVLYSRGNTVKTRGRLVGKNAF